MAAEFYGVCALVFLRAVILSKKNRIRFFWGFALLIAIVFLFLERSRASVLAFIVATLPFLWLYKPKKRSLIISSATIFGGVFMLTLNMSTLAQLKSQNTQIRLNRWMNSIAMIRDRPFGIGPGKFEFEYIPYRAAWREDPESNERVIVRSPHNEVIRLGVEYGLPLLIFLVFSLLAITSTSAN